jgi:ADP-dependent phosphofructokinase/glucokinase
MSRNKLGQFEPGTCGNPRGRPRKLPRKISPNELRKDFFEAGEILVPIIEKGKRKLIPASIAISKQLALKAASGDLRAIIEWTKMHEIHTSEHEKQQQECVLQLLKSEDIIRKFPEDVTDEYKALTKNLRSMIDPYYLP